MREKQPPQMPWRHANLICKRDLGSAVIHGATDDQLHCLAHDLGRVGSHRPGHPVWPAAMTCPETCCLRSSSELEGPGVLRQGPRAAAGPAIDAGGDDGGVHGHVLDIREGPDKTPAIFGRLSGCSCPDVARLRAVLAATLSDGKANLS